MEHASPPLPFRGEPSTTSWRATPAPRRMPPGSLPLYRASTPAGVPPGDVLPHIPYRAPQPDGLRRRSTLQTRCFSPRAVSRRDKILVETSQCGVSTKPLEFEGFIIQIFYSAHPIRRCRHLNPPLPRRAYPPPLGGPPPRRSGCPRSLHIYRASTPDGVPLGDVHPHIPYRAPQPDGLRRRRTQSRIC